MVDILNWLRSECTEIVVILGQGKSNWSECTAIVIILGQGKP